MKAIVNGKVGTIEQFQQDVRGEDDPHPGAGRSVLVLLSWASPTPLEHLLDSPDELLKAELAQVSQDLVVNAEQGLDHFKAVLCVNSGEKQKYWG